MPDWKPGDPLPEAKRVKPQIYNKVRTSVGIQADFSERAIPKGTVGTIVECYEDPEGYAVDLAIPDQKLVGDFDYENVILEPSQFEIIDPNTSS